MGSRRAGAGRAREWRGRGHTWRAEREAAGEGAEGMKAVAATAEGSFPAMARGVPLPAASVSR